MTDPTNTLADRIAEAIWSGQYRPGEWLRQIDLEDRFTATRFDVRSALTELTARQAIEHVQNRGYRVPDPDSTTLRWIADVRIILEAAAAREAVARIDDATIAALRGIAARFSHAVETASRIDQSWINREFHQVLVQACGNPVLEEAIWRTRDRYRGSALTAWSSHADLQRSARQHFEMVDALERRDADALAELIRRHIRRTEDDN